jgi:hypothetical protein
MSDIVEQMSDLLHRPSESVCPADYQNGIRNCMNEIRNLRADLNAVKAEVAALKERLATIEQIARLAPELNLNNYDHDEVCELNDAMIQLWKEVQQ